ncbi:conserved Plasmodium protein, unknown function [Plasmodium knowlesi strain H]|uniref:Uncharacterized protein n=1 Tax=Plasmodium knowlesi (strain H) TaxID=5851 RepID=A0A193R4S6_PLAKH|nr:conserved Plasmodium protein, unknown function [Plasmodium knowlesi strain H]SBO29164.1 conserved Plasmodium protein, unknown function [Plasmodium knowlesi strain H]
MKMASLLFSVASRSSCWVTPVGQRRYKSHINSVSILQQFYNRLPIRKKYIKAIKKGTLIWDKGQVSLSSAEKSALHRFSASYRFTTLPVYCFTTLPVYCFTTLPQVKIPPLKIEGYDPPKKCLSPLVKNRNYQYRGGFQNLKAHRVEFQD